MRRIPRSLNYLIALSAVLPGTISAAQADELTMFPGKVKTLKSPNGMYEIFDVDKGFSPEGEQNREIFFRKKGSKVQQSILFYHRCVNVAWSPDSSSFLLNDYAGSNVIIPYLFNVNDLKHPIEINPRLMAAVHDKKDRYSIEHSDIFSLVFSSRWINRDAVEMTCYGGGSKGVGCFKILYEWDLKNGFKKLKRTEEK